MNESFRLIRLQHEYFHRLIRSPKHESFQFRMNSEPPYARHFVCMACRPAVEVEEKIPQPPLVSATNRAQLKYNRRRLPTYFVPKAEGPAEETSEGDEDKDEDEDEGEDEGEDEDEDKEVGESQDETEVTE